MNKQKSTNEFKFAKVLGLIMVLIASVWLLFDFSRKVLADFGTISVPVALLVGIIIVIAIIVIVKR